MKKVLSLLVFFSTSAFAQTSVPAGNVSGTWTPAGSPYNVMGDITIVSSSTLVIQPGVTVMFQGHYKFNVQGALLAIGSPASNIKFTAFSSATGWGGLRLDTQGSFQDSTYLNYCWIERGKANGTGYDAYGGGIFIRNYANVAVSSCTISNNSATQAGSGVYCEGSNITISGNLIADNTVNAAVFIATGLVVISGNQIVNNSGGGITTQGGIGYVSIVSNTISANVATNNNPGAGIAFYSNGIISYNLISSNNCNFDGGGIYCLGILQTIASNTITGNQGFNGGGIDIFLSMPLIINNVISDNSATFGGGICLQQATGTPTLINNLMSNNYAQLNGGGLYLDNCKPLVTNNTMVNNDAGRGGGLYCSDAKPVLENCILYGNTASNGGDQVYVYDPTSAPAFSFCDVQGGLSAFSLYNSTFNGSYTNNLDTLPLFVSPSLSSGVIAFDTLSNWRLDSLSPCINNGNPADSYTSFDIVGNPRVNAGIIDMGAYEYTRDSVTGTPTNTNTTGIKTQVIETASAFLSPNPFSFSTRLQLSNISSGTLIIYSQAGVQLRQMTVISSDHLLIPRGDLIAGLYFFQWLDSSGSRSSGKMIVE